MYWLLSPGYRGHTDRRGLKQTMLSTHLNLWLPASNKCLVPGLCGGVFPLVFRFHNLLQHTLHFPDGTLPAWVTSLARRHRHVMTMVRDKETFSRKLYVLLPWRSVAALFCKHNTNILRKVQYFTWGRDLTSLKPTQKWFVCYHTAIAYLGHKFMICKTAPVWIYCDVGDCYFSIYQCCQMIKDTEDQSQNCQYRNKVKSWTNHYFQGDFSQWTLQWIHFNTDLCLFKCFRCTEPTWIFQDNGMSIFAFWSFSSATSQCLRQLRKCSRTISTMSCCSIIINGHERSNFDCTTHKFVSLAWPNM